MMNEGENNLTWVLEGSSDRVHLVESAGDPPDLPKSGTWPIVRVDETNILRENGVIISYVGNADVKDKLCVCGFASGEDVKSLQQILWSLDCHMIMANTEDNLFLHNIIRIQRCEDIRLIMEDLTIAQASLKRDVSFNLALTNREGSIKRFELKKISSFSTDVSNVKTQCHLVAPFSIVRNKDDLSIAGLKFDIKGSILICDISKQDIDAIHRLANQHEAVALILPRGVASTTSCDGLPVFSMSRVAMQQNVSDTGSIGSIETVLEWKPSPTVAATPTGDLGKIAPYDELGPKRITMDFERLRVVGYNVRFFEKTTSEKILLFETWILDDMNIEIGKEMDVVLLNEVTRGSDGRVIWFCENAKDCVCICAEKSRGDISALYNLAVSKGCAAFISADAVLQKDSNRVPATTMDKTFIEKLFETKSSSRTAHSVTPLETLTMLQQSNSAASNDHSLYERSSNSGILSWAAKTVTRVFFGEKSIFKDDTSSDLNHLKKYYDIGKQVEEIGVSVELLKEATLFLEKSKRVQLYQVVAAAHIASSGHESGKIAACKPLDKVVLCQLGKVVVINSTGMTSSFLTSKRRKIKAYFEPPQDVLSKFLMKHINDWGSNQGATFVALLWTSGYLSDNVSETVWCQLLEMVKPAQIKAIHIEDHMARSYVQIGLCGNLQAALDFIDQMETGGSSIRIWSSARDHFVRMIKMDFQSKKEQSFLLLSLLLDHITFVSKGDRAKDKQTITRGYIITEYIRSLLDTGGFQALSNLYDDSSITAAWKKTLRVELSAVLNETMKLKTMDFFKDSKLILNSRLLNLFVGPLRESVEAYVPVFMGSTSVPLEQKFDVLSTLFSAFVGKDRTSKSTAERFEVRMLGWVDKALVVERQRAREFDILGKCVEYAKSIGGIFSIRPFSARIIGNIVTPDAVKSILEAPPRCEWLDYGDSDSLGNEQDSGTPSSFYHLMHQAIELQASKRCRTLDEASTFMGKVHRSDLGSGHFLSKLSKALFVSTFNDCDASSFLDLYVACPSIHLCHDEHNVMHPDFLVVCRRVECLTQKWLRDFENDNLTIDQTRTSIHILRKYSDGSVIETAVLSSFEFPERSKIEAKESHLAEAEKLMEDIKDLIQINIPESDRKVTFAHVLDEYHCEPNMLDTLRRYERNACQMTLPVSSIFNDYEDLKSFVASYSDLLELCAYFTSNRSILFSRAVFQSDRESIGIEDLSSNVDAWKQDLSLVFGPGSQMLNIKNAYRTLCESNMENELFVLTSCPLIEVSEHDLASFRRAIFVLDAEKDFGCLLRFCIKAEFDLVTSSLMFSKLQQGFDQFYSHIAEKSLKDGVDFFNLVCSVLSPSSIEENPDTWLDCLSQVMPLVRILSMLFQFFDLWVYVSDQEWLGERGLQRFHQQYDNMTQVLVTSERYEMSLLDNMAECVKLLSQCYGLMNSSSLSSLIHSLGDSIVGSCDLKTASAYLPKIRTVCGKLGEIKDWFANGFDDIATARSVFDAACVRGAYYLSCADTVTTPVLHLEIESEKDSDPVQVFSGSDLDNIIQHLSLVHEKEDQLNIDIRGFALQFQNLRKAEKRIEHMFEMGYSLFQMNFSCRSGPKFCVESEEILRKTNEEYETFLHWIVTSRRSNPTSVLFSLEELREIFVLLKKEDPSVKVHLMAMLERIPQRVQDNALIVDRWQTVDFKRGWFLSVSELMKATIDASTTLSPPETASKIVMHDLHCREDDIAFATLGVLHTVYKDRLPSSFEVFRCTAQTTSQQLLLFLDRCKFHPVSTFAILNAEVLASSGRETLSSFLNDRSVLEYGIHLHILQRGDFVRGSQFSTTKMHEVTSKDDNIGAWPSLIVDGSYITDVQVVSSDSPGAGKSLYIASQLDQLLSSDEMWTVGSISIHEKSTLGTLIRHLRTFSGSDNVALHFSLNFMPIGRCQNWLSDLNFLFFSLTVLRSANDPETKTSVCLRRDCGWKFFVELPCVQGVHVPTWLRTNLPVLSLCGTSASPPEDFVVDEKTRRVCTYLRAYETGTINRKYKDAGPKRVIFLLDCSGSMSGRPFADAVRNATSVFDNHVDEGDEVGAFLFDNNLYDPVPIQIVNSNGNGISSQIASLPFYGQGTSLFQSLHSLLDIIKYRDHTLETWIVILTDGVSDKNKMETLQQELPHAPANLHLIVVGVNLDHKYEAEMRSLCNRYQEDQSPSIKGFFVRSDNSTAGLDQAFQVVKSKLPVSKTFERDGVLSENECREYITKYLLEPHNISIQDKTTISFWIQFLYRRVKVFDENESFNYNETNNELGSSLMSIMLEEVGRLLGNSFRRDWAQENHAQLIYDFAPQSPEFRLVCTAPESMDPVLRETMNSLNLPGFRVPTKLEMKRRSTLDHLLAQAFQVPLQTVGNKTVLRCIDDSHFVLTLDYFMKLLGIHERVECRLPCILEGETGVSKTALAKMYSILRNSESIEVCRTKAKMEIDDIFNCLVEEGYSLTGARGCIEELLALADSGSTQAEERILDLVKEKISVRSPLFRELDYAGKTAKDFIIEFAAGETTQTFFEICVDSSLEELFFEDKFREISKAAKRLEDVKLVVFLDEINTSCVQGLMKEIVIDRSVCGKPLEDNIVVIAACNPARRAFYGASREKDLGKSWVSGHYHVATLPISMANLRWSFGSLTLEQEKEFVFKRIEMMKNVRIPTSLRSTFTEIIACAHEKTRELAMINIQTTATVDEGQCTENDIEDRVRSVVSLRDIQRVFNFFDFFISFLAEPNSMESMTLDNNETETSAILLAVAVVYYLRLDDGGRAEMSATVDALIPKLYQELRMEKLLYQCIDTLYEATEIPYGIAPTRGLKENLFAVFVCALSRTPLIIVGPPGSSKTLAVNIVADNAKGPDSTGPFYRRFPMLSFFHYQCSKRSTSKEIAAVFDQALSRQKRVDPRNHRCVVFMDEAGLPEEERESLKVLHYLLEGHMSKKCEVGFVGISNHILDAAKSNRCVVLLRQVPDMQEMETITAGVLFAYKTGELLVKDVCVDSATVQARQFVKHLCVSYCRLQTMKEDHLSFETWFGLRDYVYFLGNLKSHTVHESTKVCFTLKDYVHSIEQNFGGLSKGSMQKTVLVFFDALKSAGVPFESSDALSFMRQPLQILDEALSKQLSSTSTSFMPRYKLIVDCTEDASLLRILRISGLVDISQRSLHMLSTATENVELERLRLISRVKFSAQQGDFVVLSQTDPVNESFYDLMNQRFRAIEGADGSVDLYTNIAVGGVSKRSLVSTNFRCVVHILASEVEAVPAPFLNRFEKYRPTLEEMSTCFWSKYGHFQAIVRSAKMRVRNIAKNLKKNGGRFGWVSNSETVESIFLGMLPRNQNMLEQEVHIQEGESFRLVVTRLLLQSTSLNATEIDRHWDRAATVTSGSLQPNARYILSEVLQSDSISFFTNALETLFSQSSDEISDVWFRVLKKVMEVLFTRLATEKLLRITPPEVIFLQKSTIPKEILTMYFDLEHFSLRRLLLNNTKTAFLLVQTRSDSLIEELTEESSGNLSVEHMERFQDEEVLHKAIDNWLYSPTRQKLIFLIDMSKDNAKEKANYVRLKVENCCHDFGVCTDSQKQFVLVLHYSYSTAMGAQCYPTLFLSGWDHWFLDTVGRESEEFQIDRLMAIACGQVAGDRSEFDLRPLLPKLVSYLSGQAIFYQEQTPIRHQGDFNYQRRRVQALLASPLGHGTLETCILNRFSNLWLNRGLAETMREASAALLTGSTHLSMSESLRSRLLQDMQVFFCFILTEANQWTNLDMLRGVQSHAQISNLFAAAVNLIPVPPIQELRLQRNRISILRPLPCLRSDSIPRFPFFMQVSAFLDQHVSTCNKLLLEREDDFDNERLFSDAYISLLRNSNNAESEHSDSKVLLDQRRNLVLNVVRIAEEDETGLLATNYLDQFLSWKAGSDQNKNWWLKNLQEMGSWKNVIGIHVVSLRGKQEIRRQAALASVERYFNTDLSDDMEFATDSVKDLRSLVALSRSTVELTATLSDGGSSRLRFFCLTCFFGNLGIPEVECSEELQDLRAFQRRTAKPQVTVFDALAFFLSSSWLRLTTAFVERDFDALLDLSNGSSDDLFLIHFVIKSFCQLDSSEGIGARLWKTAARHVQVALTDNSEKICNPRHNLLHFIPSWLRNTVERDETTACRATNEGYFDSYQHMYGGGLADTLFDVTLLLAVENHRNDSSEDIFLALNEAIENEMDAAKQHFQRQARLIAVGSTADTRYQGIVQPISIAVLITLFVSQIGYEIAASMRCVVLEGVYAVQASQFLEALMSSEEAYWQQFLISVIFRSRGEGTLIQAIESSGPLGDQSWIGAWREGSPVASKDAVNNLERAERALAEATRDEARMSEEILLCPHCRRKFMVAETNCGAFICGSDAHLLHGRRQLGNNVIGDDHGCGQGFSLSQAHHYQKNEDRIKQLRENIHTFSAKVEASTSGSRLWEMSRSLRIPEILTVSPAYDFGLPVRCIVQRPISDKCTATAVLKLFLDSRILQQSLLLLPDFIELYLWIHETFTYLVTSKYAYETSLCALICSTKLDRRFDKNQTAHISELLARAQKSFDDYKSLFGRRVAWQCEAIDIPFDNLTQAKLIEILSESGHPTDGNDFLFLMVHQIIEQYNAYSLRLLGLLGHDGKPAEIHPSYLITGLGGMSQVRSMAPLSVDEVTWIAGQAWDSVTETIDSDKAWKLMSNVMDCTRSPVLISNPLDALRNRFCFRAADSNVRMISNSIIRVGPWFFANSQDAELVERFYDATQAPTDEWNKAILHLFQGQFSTLGYEDTRSMIEGCGALLNDLGGIGACNDLSSYGFPENLNDSQISLIENLDKDKLVELLEFASYRLASEGYAFSKLPMHLWYQAPHDVLREFSKKLRDSLTPEAVHGFTCDVLCYFEKLITKAAADGGQIPMREFLHSQEFCGEEDAVFQILPIEIELRHYALLQQQLHQDKLALQQRAVIPENPCSTTTANDLSPIDDDEWLLDESEGVSFNDELQVALWFEQEVGEKPIVLTDEKATPEQIPKTAAPEPREAVEELRKATADPEQTAVLLLERWWLRCLQMRKMHEAAVEIQQWWREVQEDEYWREVHAAEYSISSCKEHSGIFEESMEVPLVNETKCDTVNVEPSKLREGSSDEQQSLMAWLYNHNLPDSVYDDLMKDGVRTIADVVMVVEEYPSILDKFPALDRFKLIKAVTSKE